MNRHALTCLFVITNIHLVPCHHLVCNHDHAYEQMQGWGPNDNLALFGPPHGMFFMFYSFFLLLTTCFFSIFSFILIMTPPIPHDARKPCVTAASFCSQGGNGPVSGP